MDEVGLQTQIDRLEARVKTLRTVVHDLTYLAKLLVAHDPTIGYDYDDALADHLAVLDMEAE